MGRREGSITLFYHKHSYVVTVHDAVGLYSVLLPRISSCQFRTSASDAQLHITPSL